jgi:hypothetical protein
MRLRLSFAGLACIVIAGCSETLSNEERLKLMVPDAKATVPVSGQVTVDGKPVKDLFVFLIPKGAKAPKGEFPASRAQCREDGSFEITTYLEGDGAPKGDYVVTFEWLKFRQTGSSWVGPDKLNGRYSDPLQSHFKVSVGDSSVTIGPFELETGPAPAGSKPPKASSRPRESKKN